ncbi:MAG: hypothetical protein HKL96_10265 [Phycisphaerales bacterium]|nr:hypothetical protein [Phycisphaerales bacterium]
MTEQTSDRAKSNSPGATTLGILSVGICAGPFAHINQFKQMLERTPRDSRADTAALEPQTADIFDRSDRPTIADVATEALKQVAPVATTVATASRTALLYSSVWGDIPATHEYLESMLADAGKYASPRAFTRSIYSTAAAMAAIALGIHGPCQTLSFDFAPVASLLGAAYTLLAADRADVVLLCWADQHSQMLQELQLLTANARLGHTAHRNIQQTLLHGAVAVAVTRCDYANLMATCTSTTHCPDEHQMATIKLPNDIQQGHSALRLIAGALLASNGQGISWLDGQDRSICRWVQVTRLAQ